MTKLNLMVDGKKYDPNKEFVKGAIERRIQEQPHGLAAICLSAFVTANIANFLIYLKFGVPSLQWLIFALYTLSVMVVVKTVYTRLMVQRGVVVNRGWYLFATLGVSIVVQSIIAVLVLQVPFLLALLVEVVTQTLALAYIAIGSLGLAGETLLLLIHEWKKDGAA